MPPRDLSLSTDMGHLANIANQRLQQRRYGVALAIMQRLIALQPTFDEGACLSLAEVAGDQFFLPVAKSVAKKILAQPTTSRLTRFKMYLLLSRLGQFFTDEKEMVENLAKAKTHCDQTKPEELAMFNRRNYHVAMHLIKGSSSPAVVNQSFAAMEWRKNISWQTSFIDKDYHQKIPLWDGKDLQADDVLLVSFEQGFGDAIQFSRFVKMIYPRAKRILFEVRAEMLELFSSQFNTAWQGTGNAADVLVFPYGCYDQALAHPRVNHLALRVVARTFLFSLPHLLGLSSPRVPQPYFSFEKLFAGAVPPTPPAPPAAPILPASPLPAAPRKKIGLVWSCGQDSNAQDRSINLKDFLPLLSYPQYQFVSLQLPPQQGEIATEGFHGFVGDLSPLIKNFFDSAKLLHGLDAVVSVDTAMAHLAAAFGKKTFLLVPFIADWRWADVAHGAPSPWYGGNLFAFHYPRFHRGNGPAEWRDVIKTLAKRLQAEVA